MSQISNLISHIPHPTSHISNLSSKNYVIIVAGGFGSRMQSAIPKQFLRLNGKPVLMHTLEAFQNCETKPYIILVLPYNFHAYWQQLCAAYNSDIAHQIVSGGETRFHSVKNGLDAINEEDNNIIVAVHDAVRPLTSRQIIDNSYKYAAQNGNAITAVKSRDSVRQLTGGISKHLLRNEIYLIQTPQTFQYNQLKKAYLQPFDPKFTDDASVVEQAGFHIHLVEGSYQNIKITFPEDIAIAEALLGMGS